MLFITLNPITETEKALKQVIDKISQYYPSYIAQYIVQYIKNNSSVITLYLNIEIPKHAPSSKPIPVEILRPLGSILTSNRYILIPGGQIWILTEPLTSENPEIDGEIQIFKNGIDQIATLKLSKISVKIPNRMSFSQPIKFGPWDVLSINFVPKKSNKSNRTITERATITAIRINLSHVNLPYLEIARIIGLILS